MSSTNEQSVHGVFMVAVGGCGLYYWLPFRMAFNVCSLLESDSVLNHTLTNTYMTPCFHIIYRENITSRQFTLHTH